MTGQRALVAVLTVAFVAAGTAPARGATPLLALPDTVRINISGAGTSYAVFGATASLRVLGPDGELYRGVGRVVARTDVRRLTGDETPLPSGVDGALSMEERLSRAELLREARLAERTASRAIVRIPFEVSALRDLDDDLGKPLFRAEAVRTLRLQAPDGLLAFNGKLYRGTFEVFPRDGRFIVVNTVETRPYLISVVGTEIPTEWHRQALAAQAIAARTYLLRHLGSHGEYDLEGDEQDQAYGGFRGEVPASERAVADTEGLVLTYRGAVVDAFYSANAGGQTEASEDVWITPLPYLRSVPSPGDTAALSSWWGASSYEWTKEYTEPALRRQLQRFGINVGTLEAIDVVERGAGGGVVRARIRGSAGTRDVLKDSTRGVFSLRSSSFSAAFRPSNERELVGLPNDATDSPLQNVTKRDRIAELEGIGAERVASVLAVQSTSSDGAAVVSGLAPTKALYRLPARIVFSGRGFGHRVGMSQWGMQGMALAGAGFTEILRHYYRGIELTKAAGP